MRCILCGPSPAINVFHEYSSFTLMRCSNCGLIFRANIAEVDTTGLIADIYNTEWIAMREKYAQATYSDHALFNLMLLEMFSPEKGALLEFGSGTGEFLHAAGNGGWRAVGIEPSQMSRAYAKYKYGVNLVKDEWKSTQDDDSAENPDLPRYDAVVFWHVLEHISDQFAFLKDIRNLLTTQGKIYFSIPNSHSLTNEVYGPESPLFIEPDHLYHYTDANVRELLNQAGFEIISIFTRQLVSVSDVLIDAHPHYGPNTPFVERMALLARWQGERRGHEICCVASLKE
ncbi:class I SAM-dependent methyltransferase [Paenibacillus sp. FSL R5-0744]|uniref:class I SAM-dependent methyltransferase n=1 Tax=Paenibacillus sp. FSL R5-0744 TaxID=2921656 RepID=UPI0030D8C6C9